MPANKEFLGEAKAHLLAAYIYSLSPPHRDGAQPRWAVSRPGDERHEATATEKR